ncbi:MAG TPA: PmoA family protein [Planctomycetaceae bacterium]|nr:PmoA family protein [Planctomycetaceae bacterium]
MNPVPRCQIIPQAAHQVSFQIDDREVLRWNAGTDYPRPFFFPVIAPSGISITRMGHPGAPDHDHHQSIWFAHNKVLGIDFWGNASGAVIRQLQWLAYDDGEDNCRMAVELGWFDGHDPASLLKQELICEVRPLAEKNEFTVELQSRFTPVSESLEFEKTNFGFLAVRVAKSVSAAFGGGILTGSEGTQTEKQLFEDAARWIDYSGATGREETQIEGITYIDHPSNPGQPTGWHVRDDGWMCASPCMKEAVTTTKESPLTLRYLLHIHSGSVQPERANALHAAFSASHMLKVIKGPISHVRWQIDRRP